LNKTTTGPTKTNHTKKARAAMLDQDDWDFANDDELRLNARRDRNVRA